MTVIACFKDFGGFLGAPNLQKCSKQMGVSDCTSSVDDR